MIEAWNSFKSKILKLLAIYTREMIGKNRIKSLLKRGLTESIVLSGRIYM